MAFREPSETSRERQMALVYWLTSTVEGMTQREIIDQVTVTGPSDGTPIRTRVKAYEGTPETVRAKFERDKVDLRNAGFEIIVNASEPNNPKYRIEKDGAFAPAINFTDQEHDVIAFALRFCGFGKSGAFSLFNSIAPVDDFAINVEVYNPIIRAINTRRVLTFDYDSTDIRSREVEPIQIIVYLGVSYLVARVRGTENYRGYRLNRIVSIPATTTATFVLTEEMQKQAALWSPKYEPAEETIEVTGTTKSAYAPRLAMQFPTVTLTELNEDTVAFSLPFTALNDAVRFVIGAGLRVQVTGPAPVVAAAKAWLTKVNRGSVPALSEITFAPEGKGSNLALAFQLLHMVHQNPEGLRISELAQRAEIDEDQVREIMGRLSCIFLPGNAAATYPAYVIKECDDWDNEETDDSLYLPTTDVMHVDDASQMMWRDLFEVNLALHEANRVYAEPVMTSAIQKIEGACEDFVRFEMAASETQVAAIRDAIANHQRVTINYFTDEADRATERTIAPTEMKMLNGYSYVRAWCFLRNRWRNFRVDRIEWVKDPSPAGEIESDPKPNWLTTFTESGKPVIVVMDAFLRFHFEVIPNGRWGRAKDGRHAVEFRVLDENFLDALMVRAGEGAVVAQGTPEQMKAGHELAELIKKNL
jgi:proteasome accessory factor C